MPAPRVLILRAPGTNCDQETAFAFELAGAKPELIHVNRLLENPSKTAEFQVICLPGGFSYGDDIAAGRILGNQIRHHLNDTLAEFRAAGKLILGICNGFQILLKSGVLLPDTVDGTAPTTLAWNDSGKFEDRWVNLAVESDRCVFLRGIQSMYLPVAHAEGKFVARDRSVLADLQKNDQLVLRYAKSAGAPAEGFPDNPNGSQANVAGLCDDSGCVFGLMPHPERYVDATHHPRWTRGEANAKGDGLAIFENAVRYFN